MSSHIKPQQKHMNSITVQYPSSVESEDKILKIAEEIAKNLIVELDPIGQHEAFCRIREILINESFKKTKETNEAIEEKTKYRDYLVSLKW